MRSTEQIRPAACPRCGYDLRGVIATWEDACDMGGTCAECGLLFEWADLLSPKRQYPIWCIEFARTPIQMIRRSYTTLTRTFRPWSFWRELQMWQDIRWGNLARYFIVLALTMYVFLVISNGLAFLMNYFSAITPTGMLPSFSWVDFLHETMYPFVGYFGSFDSFYPFIQTPWVYYRSSALNFFWSDLSHWMMSIALFTLLCPLGFICLPVSRRIAKVRWAHIIRIALYGIGYLIGVVLLAIVMSELVWKNTPVFKPLIVFGGDPVLRALMLGYPLFLVVWWSIATKRYLKMTHAWGIGLVVVVMAALMASMVRTILALITFSSDFSF